MTDDVTTGGSSGDDPAANERAPDEMARADVVAADDVADADRLLDLAEDHLLHDREEELAAVEEEFDATYADRALTSLQLGRRADIRGLHAAADGEVGVAEVAWTSAMERFREVGDEVRLQTARARLGMLLCRSDRAELGLPMTVDATDYLLAYAPADRHCGAHRRLAFVYAAVDQFDEALAALDHAAAAAPVDRDPYGLCKVLVERAGLYAQLGRIEDAAATADDGLDACRAAHYRSGLATLHWIKGRLAQERGDQEAARHAYDEALSVTTHDAFRREIRHQRATMLAGTPEAAEAIDDLVAELDTVLDEDDADSILLARYHLATAYLNASRPLHAADLLEEILVGLEPDSVAEIPVRHMLGFIYQLLDQPDVAIDQFAAVAIFARNRQNTVLVAEMNERIGEVLDRLDRDALAAAHFSDAAQAYRQSDLPTAAVRASRRAAVSHMWAREVGAAVEALGRADELAQELPFGESDARWERAMLHVDGARILARNGEGGAAIIRCAPAITLFEALGDASAAAFARTTYGELLIAAGRPGEAEPLLEVAVAEGDGTVAARARHALARVRDILGH